MPTADTFNAGEINPLTARRYPLTPITNICAVYGERDLFPRFPDPADFTFYDGILEFLWPDIEMQFTQLGKQHDLFDTLYTCIKVVKDMMVRSARIDSGMSEEDARRLPSLTIVWQEAWESLNLAITRAIQGRLNGNDPRNEEQFFFEFNRVVDLNHLNDRVILLFDAPTLDDSREPEVMTLGSLRVNTPEPDSPNYNPLWHGEPSHRLTDHGRGDPV